MDRAADYLAHRAHQLGLGRAQDIKAAQDLLDRLFPAQTRVESFNGGVLKILTPNASVASELRLRQIQIVDRLNTKERQIKKLQIQIRQL